MKKILLFCFFSYCFCTTIFAQKHFYWVITDTTTQEYHHIQGKYHEYDMELFNLKDTASGILCVYSVLPNVQYKTTWKNIALDSLSKEDLVHSTTELLTALDPYYFTEEPSFTHPRMEPPTLYLPEISIVIPTPNGYQTNTSKGVLDFFYFYNEYKSEWLNQLGLVRYHPLMYHRINLQLPVQPIAEYIEKRNHERHLFPDFKPNPFRYQPIKMEREELYFRNTDTEICNQTAFRFYKNLKLSEENAVLFANPERFTFVPNIGIVAVGFSKYFKSLAEQKSFPEKFKMENSLYDDFISDTQSTPLVINGKLISSYKTTKPK